MTCHTVNFFDNGRHRINIKLHALQMKGSMRRFPSFNATNDMIPLSVFNFFQYTVPSCEQQRLQMSDSCFAVLHLGNASWA